MTSERQHREEVVRIGRLLHQARFVAATAGNLSVRLDDTRVLITPTCVSKGMMTPDDLVVVDMSGRKLSGRGEPTSELTMHLVVYGLRPEVHGIVHAHPPTATAFAAAGLPLDRPLISELIIGLGIVPLAPYGTPGTPELSETLRPLIPLHNAILLANHGVVTYSEDLLGAYMNMETVEHFAQVALVTHQLGRQQLLSEEQVNKLRNARERYRRCKD